MTLPDLNPGHGKPYRVWTADLLPVEQLPRLEPAPGSPAPVTRDGWTVIVENGHLWAHRDGVQHQLHDSSYASDNDAHRAAYSAGLLGVMVYEHNAREHGFPAA